MNIKIIKSKRKTLSIRVTLDGEVLVKAPKYLSLRKIEAVIRQKQDWIEKSLKKVSNFRKIPHTFTEGELFYYLGENFPLAIRDKNTANIYEVGIQDGKLVVPYGSKVFLKKIITNWYKFKAKEVILDKLKNASIMHDIPFAGSGITSARSRLGSCSAKKNIFFAWRLVLAPEFVIDYVVCHELAHTKFFNHSRDFWRFVEEICPNYLEAKAWIKQNSGKLSL